MDDNKFGITVFPDLCDWCGKPILLSNESEKLVCNNCYRLLRRAGVSDEEIYKNAIYKSES